MGENELGEVWVAIDDLFPAEGLEVLAYSPGTSDHYGESEGWYEFIFREEGEWFFSKEGVLVENFQPTHWKYINGPMLELK